MKIWIDTDIMIGLPEQAPREVDDAVALLMALRHPQLTIAGISTVTYVDYGSGVVRKMLEWYHHGVPIPVYSGSDTANDLGVENEATRALAAALQREPLHILALGPVTNLATVVLNHPHLIPRIREIVFCMGRSENFEFKPGLGQRIVGDYNLDTHPEAMQVLLDTPIPLVLSGFEASKSLLLGPVDIDRLASSGHPGDRWLHSHFLPWIALNRELFGVEGFIPFDATPLGYFTHPHLFEYSRDIPVLLQVKPNRAHGEASSHKPHLEVSYHFESPRKVTFVKRSLPGFEEEVIKALLGWQT